ncbi:enoyl-CoA hydratase-related protein [Nocardioides sp. B-3]|nr:enoyl-CoA hydratase-related protein [Nocardioides sp. B-3]UUZ61782.1 enoyl-CoA hydratase-related protein [Nocardioides sp. B-3]
MPAAGADLTALRSAGSADAIRTIAELGHFVFGKLDSTVGGKKSFGFINGLALGGGFEVALNCDYRTVLESIPAAGLPEVMLGPVPGWGGARLVPNPVGAGTAVKVALENPLNRGKVLKGRGGLRPRPRRRHLRRRRLPRAVAALGVPGCSPVTSPSSVPRWTAAGHGTTPSPGVVRSPRARPVASPSLRPACST